MSLYRGGTLLDNPPSMLTGRLPTKRQRELMRDYYNNPFILSQTAVMKALRIKERHEFYRLFTRCVIADRMEEIERA